MSALVVIVPVYNEGENIQRWWEKAHPHLPSDTVIRIVHDLDEDTTVPVVERLRSEGAPMTLVRNRAHGVLQAMLTGLDTVETGPVLLSMADGSDDFSSLPSMLKAYREGATVVVASRFMLGGAMHGGPWVKSFLARWGGRSLHWIAGFPVQDATNNFRMYDAAFVRTLHIESTGGFELAFEITLKAWCDGKSIVEIPTIWRERTLGDSRFRLKKWVPLYAELWLKAIIYGVRSRLR